ncbi:hypothetical protein [Micromonospora sp. HM5-17]|uniref:hypothetical protein n=1 Tax=Micromonospora sp. HM5-17 TaxID=2487710 RepID=UPI000F49F82C|nr:hypothetical protein [Micromonospora sp. HM5-17]ROT28208.1 hypothetical protein EF879_21625 [Micromonospora sp. HM5-17]
MRGTHLAELFDGADPGVADALDVVSGFDEALVPGLARVGAEQQSQLAALAGAVAVTPLRERTREAVEKVAAGSFGDEHLAMLAGARTALLGAVHDALLERLDTALGRPRATWATAEAPAPSVSENLMAGVRSWLREVAIAGWRGVDHDLVSASAQTAEAVLAVPALRRLAVLLDGLAAELRASCPVATMERLPLRRWADLWSRALLLAQPGGLPGSAATPVSGRLLPLGVDVHEHGTAVQVQVHAVLESADVPPRLVRTSLTTAKVETIVGPAVWRLLRGAPVLFKALAEHRALEITDVPLLPGGDLVWQDGSARPGETVEPFATARLHLGTALAPAVPPLERHPVRIAEPVLLEGYAVAVSEEGESRLDVDGQALTVDVARLPGCGPLTPDLVAASSACLGLVRWDGGRWLLQPLAVQVRNRRGTTEAHTADWALGPTDPKVVRAEARAGDAVAVLRERAGRLLRR